MAELNLDGNIEVYTGPRGYYITGASGDGKNVTFKTNNPEQPELNPIPLPVAKQGATGRKGDPGAGSFRIDETVGVRVFVWELYAPYEVMVYGDTGVRSVSQDGQAGTLRRVGNTVEATGAMLETLPDGFKPAASEQHSGVFLTADRWPSTLPGEQVTAPVLPKGFEGYSAAVAGGYPGTPEQWVNDRYRVLPDPAKVPQGHVLTRTATGLEYAPLPQIGPGPWRSLTLDKTWKVTSHLGNRAQTRTNNDRVDFYGHVTYTGPTVEAGMWSWDGVRLGVVAPQDAPLFNIELVVITYEGASGAGRPVPGRLHVSDKGVVQLMYFSDNGKEQTLTVKAGVTQIGLTGLSYPARPQ